MSIQFLRNITAFALLAASCISPRGAGTLLRYYVIMVVRGRSRAYHDGQLQRGPWCIVCTAALRSHFLYRELSIDWGTRWSLPRHTALVAVEAAQAPSLRCRRNEAVICSR